MVEKKFQYQGERAAYRQKLRYTDYCISKTRRSYLMQPTLRYAMPDLRRRIVEQALFRGSELTFANKDYLRTVRTILTTRWRPMRCRATRLSPHWA
jgi:hypothetical protein